MQGNPFSNIIVLHILISSYMSRQATRIHITEKQRATLENVYRNGSTHSFRMRCLMVSGKADGLSNAAAAELAGQKNILSNVGKKYMINFSRPAA